MINNEYAYELDFDFNLTYLEELINNSIKNKNLKTHQRLAANDEYLSSLKTKFPLLSSLWNFYNIVPYYTLPPHIDAARTCALNIPIKGTSGSSTIFYKSIANPTLRYDTAKVLNWVDDELVPAFEFELTKPTLIRNNVPHAVVNGPFTRMILSWSVSIDYSFDEAKEFFQNFS